MLQFFCLGDHDTCAGFKLAGVSGVTPESIGSAAGLFTEILQNDDVAILIITEAIAEGIKDSLAAHRMSGRMPMIVEIPENLSGEFTGRSLMDSIKQAVGISL